MFSFGSTLCCAANKANKNWFQTKFPTRLPRFFNDFDAIKPLANYSLNFQAQLSESPFCGDNAIFIPSRRATDGKCHENSFVVLLVTEDVKAAETWLRGHSKDFSYLFIDSTCYSLSAFVWEIVAASASIPTMTLEKLSERKKSPTGCEIIIFYVICPAKLRWKTKRIVWNENVTPVVAMFTI